MTEPADDAAPTAVVAVDLGKTRCRIRIDTGSGDTSAFDGVGAPGLAADRGVDDALAAIFAVTEGTMALSGATIGVGAAGALNAPEQAAGLAHRLRAATGARVAVSSDIVTAHLGALAGDTGVLLIAGTGAAALGIQDDSHRLVDGWGPELGDLGSGSWIGRSALRETLRAAAGLGPRSPLTDELASTTGGPVRWLAEAPHTARRLASLVPVIVTHAERGDPIGVAVLEEAARLLAASAKAAGAPGATVAVHGGLTDSGFFRERLQRALRSSGLDVVPARGDALDGAHRIACGTAPLHERFVHRAG